MTDQPAKSGEEDSKKTLVRILIIVGIGIPVLVELLTLFNLINVQLFEEEKVPEQQARPAEVEEFMVGDTLFADAATPIAISEILIKVSAQSWRFELTLAQSGSTAVVGNLVAIDSLKLKSGEVLSDTQKWEVNKSSRLQKTFEWLLPSGDIPTVLYMSSRQSFSKDSVANLRLDVQLGNIPVRYSQDKESR